MTTDLFTPVPSGKIQCTICGRRGWPGYGPRHWTNKCRAGHPYECPVCKRRFATRHAIGTHSRAHKKK